VATMGAVIDSDDQYVNYVGDGSTWIDADFTIPNYVYTNGLYGFSCYNQPIDCNTTGGAGAPVPVQPPDHLLVVQDAFTTNPNCAPGANVASRQITFNAAAADNPTRPLTGALPMQELFSNVTGNTCPDHSLPAQDQCVSTGGQWTDIIQNNCSSAGSNCGYTLTDQWQWCPGPSHLPATLGTLNDIVQGTGVTVNGNTGGFPPATTIYP
jgi:hypothetical protein